MKCEICGRFIGYEQSYLTEVEPLSEFGPEKITVVHTACEAKAIEARRATTTQIGVVHESAVAESETPTPHHPSGRVS